MAILPNIKIEFDRAYFKNAGPKPITLEKYKMRQEKIKEAARSENSNRPVLTYNE